MLCGTWLLDFAAALNEDIGHAEMRHRSCVALKIFWCSMEDKSILHKCRHKRITHTHAHECSLVVSASTSSVRLKLALQQFSLPRTIEMTLKMHYLPMRNFKNHKRTFDVNQIESDACFWKVLDIDYGVCPAATRPTGQVDQNTTCNSHYGLKILYKVFVGIANLSCLSHFKNSTDWNKKCALVTEQCTANRVACMILTISVSGFRAFCLFSLSIFWIYR